MEESKSSSPPRCPCGFWGSANTMGLCSKCYKGATHDAHQEKAQEATEHKMRKPDAAMPLSVSTGTCALEGVPQACSSREGTPILPVDRLTVSVSEEGETDTVRHTPVISNTMCIDTGSVASPSGSVATHPPVLTIPTSVFPANSETHQTTCLSTKNISEDKKSATEVDKDNNLKITDVKCVTEKESTASSSTTSDSTANKTPDKDSPRGLKRDLSALEDSTPECTPEKGKQKSKKRCHQCNSKLELAQRQIGRCKCDFIFCALHRLPELHQCDFDHKEEGRKEARQKMVKPTRHLGNEFRRLESDS